MKQLHLKLGGENIVVSVVIVISSKFPCYRAFDCIKMGKHNPHMQIAQWKCPRTKLKLKFTPNAKPTATYVEVSHHQLILPWVHQIKMAENTNDEELDLDVVEMTFTKTDSAYATLCLSAGLC